MKLIQLKHLSPISLRLFGLHSRASADGCVIAFKYIHRLHNAESKAAYISPASVQSWSNVSILERSGSAHPVGRYIGCGVTSLASRTSTVHPRRLEMLRRVSQSRFAGQKSNWDLAPLLL